jgi:hypothetical protein
MQAWVGYVLVSAAAGASYKLMERIIEEYKAWRSNKRKEEAKEENKIVKDEREN